MSAQIRGAHVHQVIEDEAAYMTGDADIVRVNGLVARERVRGGFETRWRIQWFRWRWRILRELFSRDTLWNAREVASTQFHESERRAACPHRDEWQRRYDHGAIRCEACGWWRS